MKAKTIILALLCLCLSGSIIAQNRNEKQAKIQGIIKDSESGNPLEFATAVLLKGSDSTIVSISISDTQGAFIFTNLPIGNYIIKAVFMGYIDTEQSIKIEPGQTEVTAKDIILRPASNQLAAAVVTAKVPLIERKIDKLVMNVENVVSSDGNTAMELLERAPGVTVDKDGNIKLLGSGVLVQIDGRETFLSAADLATLLGGMDASEISKIEIINSPSSRQDAQGSSGIINIRTRKSILSGINGTINAGVAAAKYWGYNGGASLNYRNAWMGAYGSYNYRFNDMFNDIDQIRNFHQATPPSVYESFTKNRFTNRRGNYRFGLDFYLNPKNTLGVLISGNHGTGESTSDAKTTNTIASGIESKSISHNTRDDNNNGITANANYRKLFDKDGQTFTIDADYARFKTTESEFRNNHFFNLVTNRDSVWLINTHSPRQVEVYSGRTDYVQPIGTTAQIELGAKFSNSETNSALDWENNLTGKWIPDPKRSNNFEYTERIMAAYTSISKQFGEKFSIKAGIRWEHTWSKGFSPTTNEENINEYDDFFPTLFMQYKASESHDLSITYNRRIQRPDYDALNPFRNYLDAYTYVSGNPNLRPQYTDNVSLTHSFKNKLITTVFYQHQQDLIVQVPEQSGSLGESGVIQDNFGYVDMVGVSVAVPNIPITKWWAFSANAWGGWTHNHSMQNAVVYDNYNMMGQLHVVNNFTFAKTWRAEVAGDITSPTAWGFFKIKSQYWASVGVKKSFFDNKLNFTVNFDDPFNWAGNLIDVKYDKFDYHFDTRWQSRRVRVGVVWRFGSTKSKPVQERRRGNEDEMSRIKNE